MSSLLKAKRHWQEIGFSMLYLVPTLGLFILFCVYPYLQAFAISFYDWSPFTATGTFIGLDNYRRLIDDRVVWGAFLNNLFLLFWCTIITFIISIFFAAIFNRKNYRENNLLKIIFFIPHVLSVTVVAILWTFLYNPSFGIINAGLEAVGLESLTRVWLGERDVIMGAITAPLVWISVGFYMILFYSAMSNVSSEIYESADVDGAGEMRMFFSITLPSIWENIRSALAFFIISAFNFSFQLVYVMTGGGPNRASELLTTYQYETAFRNGDFGYSSAIGMVLFVLTAASVFLVLRATRQKEG